MGRALMQMTLFGLLLTLVATHLKKDDWDIYSFHINSTVSGRYATTVITSRVANRMNEAKEVEFQVRIPKNAFISKFTMLIDGHLYDGVVKDKEQAQQQYTSAVSRGQSAGLVSSVGRALEEFKTSVNVAAHKKVTFELTYEELLKRRLGKYKLQINACPMQPVKDFKVDLYVYEKVGIRSFKVEGGLSTKDLANAVSIKQTEKEAWVYFYPTEDQQKRCDSCGEQGMNGDLLIFYDVNRDIEFGDIKKSNGCFLHYFAPANLPRIPKNVVFVIDQSGSMSGTKIQQTRAALVHILNDLNGDDYFALITFDHEIIYWKRELVQATEENVQSAKTFARSIPARGNTDINAGVLEGARILNTHSREGSASILILLTDGDPNTGVTDVETIQSNVKAAIADKFPLYCLGFGFDVKFEFLEKMSLQNNGAARRLYEDSDADLQLKGFYNEVATPLLTNVSMTYSGGTNLTQTHFSQYYNGSEIVVAGQITDNNIETFTPEVIAISRTGRVSFSDTRPPVESTETGSERCLLRIWAYLTVKQLLDKELQLSGSEKDKIKKEALELSLKYSFVTPLTSMVVTKPEGENTDVLHKPREDKTNFHQARTQHHSGGGVGGSAGGSGASTYGGGAGGVSAAGSYGATGAGVGSGTSAYGGGGVGGSAGGSGASAYGGGAGGVSAAGSYGATGVGGVPGFHRFFIPTEFPFLPLCFDIPVGTYLKLFHHPSEDLSMIGVLDSKENRGFNAIAIPLKNDQFIQIRTDGITIQQKQGVTHNNGQNSTTADIAVVGRDKEFDIRVGDTHIIIFVREVGGDKFLWPVLRQRPSDSSIEGILALKPADYDVFHQLQTTKVKIKDQMIAVTRSMAVDYSQSNPGVFDCWLMPAESALQGRLEDFTVAPF